MGNCNNCGCTDKGEISTYEVQVDQNKKKETKNGNGHYQATKVFFINPFLMDLYCRKEVMKYFQTRSTISI